MVIGLLVQPFARLHLIVACATKLLDFEFLGCIVSVWVLHQPSLVLEYHLNLARMYLLQHLCFLVVFPILHLVHVIVIDMSCLIFLDGSQTRRGLSMDNTGKALGNLHIGTLHAFFLKNQHSIADLKIQSLRDSIVAIYDS